MEGYAGIEEAGIEEVRGVHVAEVVNSHAGDPGCVAEPTPGGGHVVRSPGPLSPVVGEDVGQLDEGRTTSQRVLDLRSPGRKTGSGLDVDGDGPLAVGLGVLLARGFLVGRPGLEPGTLGLKVHSEVSRPST